MNPIVSNENSINWKIENVVKQSEFDLESDTFSFYGVQWKIHVYCTETHFRVDLCYDSENRENSNWICELVTKFTLFDQSGDKNHTIMRHRDYINLNYDTVLLNMIRSNLSIKSDYVKDESIDIQIDFDFNLYDYSIKIKNYTNVIIRVRGTDFHLNKAVLSTNSKYFFDLFITNGSNDEIIDFPHVNDDDFCLLLASFSPFFDSVSDFNYEGLIELAEQFQVSSLHYKCEQFLLQDKKIDLIDKVEYADLYGYKKLMKSCIESLKGGIDIKKLYEKKKFSNLSKDTKLQIMMRFLDFY